MGVWTEKREVAAQPGRSESGKLHAGEGSLESENVNGKYLVMFSGDDRLRYQGHKIQFRWYHGEFVLCMKHRFFYLNEKERPIMTKEISTKYNPQQVEAGRYAQWLESGVFRPAEDSSKEAYSVVIPPPNVTGKLHLGHAWDVTLQDMIIRQKRMQGYDTLWLPGMDHAGIATQGKVEERLREAEGKSRHDLGRQAFVERIWQWKEEYAGIIRDQWAKMGISVDYDRERFTLDEGLNEAVRKVFVDLYDKGLIYRGEYIINWDPVLQTALSDIEVEYQDDAGALYHIRYPFADGSGYLDLATTRPETMLGDTGVAVHPEDDRYQDFVGKQVILPLVGREIPVLADDYVDPEYGTGVVKITPAHDPNDFELGNRHHLERINIMEDDGRMNASAGKYAGMTIEECRKAVVADLKDQGYLVDIEPIVHAVGHSERSGAVVEPRLSTQWFVKMQPLAEQAIRNQDSENKVHFYPARFEKTFLTWMENVHDWVISRQLWWGHQIPAWYHKETGEIYVGLEAPEDLDNWQQDPDVLDTWFSSALWPFSTMGWPDLEAEDFNRYFPTDTLVTGYDIIFFWVSRMIFQSLEFTQERPFKNVLIHGLIRDADGRKMSKSLGNGIDPMDVIEEYGVDALRWFLANGSAPGQDIRYSEEKLAAAWNFINKIWNASRYVLMNVEDIESVQEARREDLELSDRWILSRLQTTIEEVTRLFDRFEFGEAGKLLYQFIWHDYCDWYIEMTKERLQSKDRDSQAAQAVLIGVLDLLLRLLHPIMPFVTEEIWQQLQRGGQASIVVADYPVADLDLKDLEAERAMDQVIDIIRSVRTIRSDAGASLSKAIDIYIQVQDSDSLGLLESNRQYIDRFCNPDQLVIALDPDVPEEVMSASLPFAEVMMPLAGLVKLDEEINRLQAEDKKLQEELTRVEKKLANENFLAKAPEKVVQAERDKGQAYQAQQDILRARIQQLEKLLKDQ